MAEVLTNVEADACHDKGDEFLCRGSSYHELNQKLSRAQIVAGRTVCRLRDGRSHHKRAGSDTLAKLARENLTVRRTRK
jgi:hypothetical protein